MGLFIPLRTSQVSLPSDVARTLLTLTESDKNWSFGEWIQNFMRYDNLPYLVSEEEEGLYDNVYDDTITGGDMYDDVYDDDGLSDNFLIIGVVLALMLLLYYRQVRQQRHDEQQGRRGQQAGDQGQDGQNDRGVFPGPGDPNVANWMAGGIGH